MTKAKPGFPVQKRCCLNPQPSSKPPFAEFVVLIALMTSIIALSIDAMLPALPAIGQDLGVKGANSKQLIVSLLFLGLALGQIVYGPLSDSVGRKPPIYAGFILFILGSLLSLFATNFQLMLVGRFLQGLGVAGPRAVSLALVRDRYEGAAMARVMSYVMTVFILVPMLAPAYGQAILLWANWRWIFASFIILAVLTMLWFFFRQAETLPKEKRKVFSFKGMLLATAEILRTRTSLAYILAAGLVSGAFLGYLNSAQQIFQEQYQLATLFPLYFAIVALALGGASFVNAQLVMRFGMKLMATRALYFMAGLSLTAFTLALLFTGHPPLALFMAYLLTTFFCVGILFGNLNALAMQPLGHIAGLGAAIVGSLSTLISVPLGMLIGLSYNGTIIPLLAGLAILASMAVIIVRWAEHGKISSS